KQSNKIKICYASENIDSKALFIKKQGLLDKDAIIIPKNLQIHRWKHSTILFYNQPGKEMPFDIFSAVFFLISRMEEYVLKTALIITKVLRQNMDFWKSLLLIFGFYILNSCWKKLVVKQFLKTKQKFLQLLILISSINFNICQNIKYSIGSFTIS